MEIKAKAAFDIESMKALVHLWMFKKADPKKRMITWNILYGILLSVLIFEMIIFGATVSMVVLVCICVFVCLLECYWYFILPKVRYKALGDLKDVANEYTFYDDIMLVITKSENYNGESEIKYSSITKVYETSQYFFLYQNKNYALLVDKHTFEDGTPQELAKKLISVLGNNYIFCNY